MNTKPLLAAAAFAALNTLASPARADCVILLHGLARSSASMTVMEEVLEVRGYDVVAVDYPSTTADIQTLVDAAMPPALEACGPQQTHVVAHSMGGVMTRLWLRDHDLPHLGRVVMLGTPNQGSELVDELEDIEMFHWLNGPAGAQLATGDHGIIDDLPAASFDLGVIAGDLSFNPIFSNLVEGPDDGKVSVASTRVEGMRDHIVLNTTHTFMMTNPEVIAQTVAFIENGAFETDLDYGAALNRVMGWTIDFLM